MTPIPDTLPEPAQQETCVVIVSQRDLSPELAETPLWRSDVRRLCAADITEARVLMRTLQPRLVLIDAAGTDGAAGLVRSLHADPEIRFAAIAVLLPDAAPDPVLALLRAGADLVLSCPLRPGEADVRLERLLAVPVRRALRMPVRLLVWSPGLDDLAGLLAVEIGLGGMRLEADRPLGQGRLEFQFVLPGDTRAVSVVGQVVRQVARAGMYSIGVRFDSPLGDAREQIRGFVERGVRVQRAEPAASTTSREAPFRLALLEASPDALLAFNGAGQVVAVNRAAEQLLGRPREDAQGRLVQELLAPPIPGEESDSTFLQRLLLAARERRRLVAALVSAHGGRTLVEVALGTVRSTRGDPLVAARARPLLILDGAAPRPREDVLQPSRRRHSTLRLSA